MPTRRNPLASFIGYVTLLLAFTATAEPAGAQAAAESAVATKSEVVSAENAPGPVATQATAMKAKTDPANAQADSDSTESGPVHAKTDPPKDQPLLSEAAAVAAPTCRNISADVVALYQPIMLNRLGAAIPNGLVFALRSDLDTSGTRLREGKRPRPLVLRANVGDCLTINFTNTVQPPSPQPPPPPPSASPTPPPLSFPSTTQISIHVQGMEWVKGSQDDGSYVGLNPSSLAGGPTTPNAVPPKTRPYTLYAKNEGTFLLYTMGDTASTGDQLLRGLFGALNVQPAGAEWYRSQVTADDMALATYNENRLPSGAALSDCNPSNRCTLTINVAGNPPKRVQVLKTRGGNLNTLDNHPLINYDAVYPSGPRAGTPILKMLDATNKIVYSDLTAMITGPGAGRFPGTTGPNNPEPACNAEGNPTLNPPPGGRVDPLFCANPASPDRKQPYREITIIYHGSLNQIASQAFPVFTDAGIAETVTAGADAFAINYGTGGIGAEIYANRIGVGPMGDCVDCKYEEFFLSAWSVGDPAMLVDRPANSNFVNMQNQRALLPPCNSTTAFEGTKNAQGNPLTPPNPNCANARQPVPGAVGGQPYTLAPLAKATKAFFPEDPSNVYHSYINDHVKFRILHGGVDVTHVHHQHAHQWLQSPNSDQGSYLDSQMISPGASYTLEMVYNGSGNRNKVVGDSIFHCHFYPHFAAGMWAMWRTHDVFEAGTYVFTQGATRGQAVPGSRALPDGEIKAGTPTPAIVPLPTLPMAPIPAYAQIQNNVPVNGVPITIGGQVVIGGTCQSNKINGLDVIGGCTNGQKLNGTVINSQFDGTQMTGQFQPSPSNRLENPGFPYFIPGIAGARAPHPPLDFARDPVGGDIMDGGLPRHVATGGTVSYERHDQFDWSKDLSKMNAVGLPEDGTDVEKAAMTFFGRRCYATFFPDGTPGSCPSSNSVPPQSTLNTPPTGFLLNGLPRKNPAGNSAEQLGATPGAPFADPAIDDNGNAVGSIRRYKAAAIQLDVTLNKKGWHYPQQRILTLWQDVLPTYKYKFGNPSSGRQPEPLFFRGNSGDIIEYWHTNLVPNYYLVDDFQVRTPTDILGQHIHLVKFDVTSSDGAANGFNYEDGTYSPQEVQEMITAINATGGLVVAGGPPKMLSPKMPPKEIVDCAADPTNVRCQPCPHNQTATSRPQCQSWLGAQTTIQRWYLDPLLDNSGVDRTLRTVFTHDHFGPSTHQQAGLYAGLLVEPSGSTWKNSETGEVMPNPATRSDGGPTSWKADILARDEGGRDVSYREFALEFQDFQLAYMTASATTTTPPITQANANPSLGWRDRDYAITPPSTPQLISTALIRTPGTNSVNYLNEPLPFRVGQFGDLSYAYDSSFKLASNAPPNGDPVTPLMRAYQNDNVQVRILVGAHVFAHQFNLEGPTWFAEPSWKNSGYRSAQAMGLSEHFEFLFRVPSSAATTSSRKCPDGTSAGNCVDYLYSPSLDESGLSNGLWGLFRAYNPAAVSTDPNKPATEKLQFLTNNTAAMNTNSNYSTCPATLQPPAVRRVFNIFAVTAQRALADISPVVDSNGNPVSPRKGWILFNDRGNLQTPPRREQTLHSSLGIMYVRGEDLVSADPANPNFGKLKPGAPVEPLILRANAGDCIEVNLTNALPTNSDVFTQSSFRWAPPFDGNTQFQSKPSFNVGLHPQLLSYDAAQSNGINVGWNSQGQKDQVVGAGKTITYQWYAGKIDRDAGGNLTHTPVEFGSLNLFPSDPVFQPRNGLFGSMVIDPAGSSWTCDKTGTAGGVDCDQSSSLPTTRASATVTLADTTKKFREFVMMISDDMLISQSVLNGPFNTSAVNYRTEPFNFRYLGFNTADFSCMLSNQLRQRGLQIDPRTPVFTAGIGDAVRFRMTHPFGTGTSQVFSLHGHVWQRNPYTNDSKALGDQSLSQWIGSRDNHGSTDHFDLVIDKAGGENAQAGDYLYTVFVPNQAALGAWGVFRVGQSTGMPTTDPACITVQPLIVPTQKRELELERFIRQPPDNINPRPQPGQRPQGPIAPNPNVKP